MQIAGPKSPAGNMNLVHTRPNLPGTGTPVTPPGYRHIPLFQVGSMPRVKLSQHVVDRLPAPHPSGKQTPYWDEDLTGYGCLCSGKTTAKTYIVQRDLKATRKTRRVTTAWPRRCLTC